MFSNFALCLANIESEKKAKAKNWHLHLFHIWLAARCRKLYRREELRKIQVAEKWESWRGIEKVGGGRHCEKRGVASRAKLVSATFWSPNATLSSNSLLQLVLAYIPLHYLWLHIFQIAWKKFAKFSSYRTDQNKCHENQHHINLKKKTNYDWNQIFCAEFTVEIYTMWSIVDIAEQEGF